MSAGLYTESHPGRRLQTLAGLIHGLVGRNPWRVQCDGCFVVRSGDCKAPGAQTILARIRFNPRARAAGDHRRLCDGCAATEWKEYRA